MASKLRVHALGGARGQVHIEFSFFFLRTVSLSTHTHKHTHTQTHTHNARAQSRAEDLNLNVRAYALGQVYKSALYTTLVPNLMMLNKQEYKPLKLKDMIF